MSKRVPETIEPILGELREGLETIYGNRLKGLVLHGSYARGDFSDGSDIDIIMLLEGMENLVAEHERYFDAVWELDLKYDTVISVLPVREEDYRTRSLPVILNARKEGIPI